jgi:hypothetical protein
MQMYKSDLYKPRKYEEYKTRGKRRRRKGGGRAFYNRKNGFELSNKTLQSLYKNMVMVCRRHRNEKPEGSKATGKRALKGSKQR